MKKYLIVLLLLLLTLSITTLARAEAREYSAAQLATTIWNHDDLRMEYEYQKKNVLQAQVLAAFVPGFGHHYAESDQFWRWFGVGTAGLLATVLTFDEESRLSSYINLAYLVWKGVEIMDAGEQAELYNRSLRAELEDRSRGAALEFQLVNYSF